MSHFQERRRVAVLGEDLVLGVEGKVHNEGRAIAPPLSQSRRERFGPSVKHRQVLAVSENAVSLLAGQFVHNLQVHEMLKRLADCGKR